MNDVDDSGPIDVAVADFSMARFLKSQNIGRESLKPFLLEQADLARRIAEQDGTIERLVCVLSVVDPFAE